MNKGSLQILQTLEKIIKEYHKQPDSSTADDLNEMNKFHKTYNLPKLTPIQEHENSPTSI